MAARFWVGGTGSWDNSATTHWSATSGGVAGASAPTSADDVTLDASSGGGTVTMGANVTVNSITMGAFTGTLNDGGFSPTMVTFSGTGTGVRSLTMTGSWTVTGSNALVWDCTTTTSLTVTATGSTITFTGSSAQINANKTWGSIVFTGASTNALPHITNSLTCANLTYNAPAGSLGQNSMQPTTVIVTSVLTLSGPSAADRMSLRGSSRTVQRTITVNGSVSLSNVDFQTIKTAGTAGTWTGTSLGNAGGNTGITTTTPKTVYWVGDTGNWNDAANHWASTSGGTPGLTNYPLPQDTATFDANSFTANTKTVTLNMLRYSSIDCSAVTKTGIVLSQLSTPVLHGSITLVAGVIFSGSFVDAWQPIGAATLTTAGNAFGTGSNGITLDTPLNGTGLALLDDLVQPGNALLTVTGGTFETNNHNVTTGSFVSIGAGTRVVNMGTGTWTLRRTTAATFWNMTNTGITLNASTSTILITGSANITITMIFAGLTYNNFTFTGTGGASAILAITSGGIFNAFTMAATGVQKLTVTNGQTITATSFNLNTSPAASVLTVASDSAGVPFTFSQATGTVIGYALSIKDSTASGGATFIAGAPNSVNVSGNTGWTFGTSRTSSPSVETVTHTDTFLKQGTKVLADTITYTDSLIRQGTKVLADTLTSSDALLRVVSKVLVDTTTMTAVLSKQAYRALAEAITAIDTFVLNSSIFRTFTDSVTMTALLIIPMRTRYYAIKAYLNISKVIRTYWPIADTIQTTEDKDASIISIEI